MLSISSFSCFHKTDNNAENKTKSKGYEQKKAILLDLYMIIVHKVKLHKKNECI